ncbi:phenylalanine--tRNA ligase subunit beta, partial [Verrucomicrobia bacterium]|nr:phenylalanine--tRNA ligase subunit beta [Verrucomicrobiota bacterium]
NVVRPSLIPGLLDILQYNANHGVADIALFEIGRAFPIVDGVANEDRKLTVTITGKKDEEFWSNKDDPNYDMLDLMGILETLFDRIGIRGIQNRRNNDPTKLFAESANLVLGKKSIGVVGHVMPTLAWNYDCKAPVFFAELSLDTLLSLARGKISYKPLPEQPSSRRDIAMLVDETVSHQDVEKAIRRSKPDYLESIRLFDIYRSGDLGEGKKSIAYALTYRHPERTLKDKEVDKNHAKVVASLENNIGAQIR